MASVIIIKPTIVFMTRIKRTFHFKTTKTDPICLPAVKMLWQVSGALGGEMGKGTSSGSKSLRMVADSHGWNRNPFALEFSNHSPLLSTFPSHALI